MKKAFLLVLLLTIVSLAQAQSGRWGHVTQINPDSLSPTNYFFTNAVKIVATSNNLWAFWTHEIDNMLDTIVLHAGRYNTDMYSDHILWDREYFNYFDLFKDTRGQANILADVGPLPTKQTGKRNIWGGFYQSQCLAYDTTWSPFLSADSMGLGFGMGPTVNDGDSTVLIWSQTDYKWLDRPGDIYSNVYKPSIGWGEQKMEADGDDLISYGPPLIVCDAKGKIWKGWNIIANPFLYGWSRQLVVNHQYLDTTIHKNPILFADKKNTVVVLWIGKTDSAFYRVNVDSIWQPKQFLTFADNIMSTKDRFGVTWVAKTLDSVIYVCTYDSLTWSSWDSLRAGYLNCLTVDQTGNPVIGFFNNKNIYSAIYCRDTLLPTVNITSPVAGSEYIEGQQVPVHCTYSGDAAFLNIYCRRSGSSEWQKLFDMVPVDSSMNWTVPGDSSDYSFKAEAIDSGWNTSLDSTGWFAVKPLGVQGAPNEQAKVGFGLRNSGPNPFKQSAVINYQLPNEGPVRIKVYNASGQLVKTIVNASQKAGAYTARWNGSNEQNIPASAGVYVCRLSAAGQTASVKLIKLK